MEKFDVPFLAYESSIKGRVQMQEGKLLFTGVTVRPEARIKEKKTEKILRKAKYCLVSASVKTEIQILPEVI